MRSLHLGKKNDSLTHIIINALLASGGLGMFAFGVYLTIQANIGVAPWDTLNLGLSGTFGISYGTANILVSMVLVVIDILLREQIGIGMFLDAVLVGKFVDLFDYLEIIPLQNSLPVSLILMAAGMFVMGFSQFLYMSAGLGCGPRDTLLVGLSRKLRKIPIGVISIVLLATVTFAGWRLGGQVGIGTVICAFLEGPIMEFEFRLVHFEPTAVSHQNIIASAKVTFRKKQ